MCTPKFLKSLTCLHLHHQETYSLPQQTKHPQPKIKKNKKKRNKLFLKPPPPQHLYRCLDCSWHHRLAQSRNLHFPMPWSVNRTFAQQMGLLQTT